MDKKAASRIVEQVQKELNVTGQGQVKVVNTDNGQINVVFLNSTSPTSTRNAERNNFPETEEVYYGEEEVVESVNGLLGGYDYILSGSGSESDIVEVLPEIEVYQNDSFAAGMKQSFVTKSGARGYVQKISPVKQNGRQTSSESRSTVSNRKKKKTASPYYGGKNGPENAVTMSRPASSHTSTYAPTSTVSTEHTNRNTDEISMELFANGTLVTTDKITLSTSTVNLLELGINPNTVNDSESIELILMQDDGQQFRAVLNGGDIRRTMKLTEVTNKPPSKKSASHSRAELSSTNTCSTIDDEYDKKHHFPKLIPKHSLDDTQTQIINGIYEMKSVWDLTNETFKCSQCTRGFRMKDKWERHEQLHLEAEPFPCEFCGRVFFKEAYLRNHIDMHDTKDVVLPVKKKRPRRTKKEMQQLLNMAEFRCSECDGVFSKYSQLTGHIERVHHKRSHECLLCGKVYASRDKCKKHMLKHPGPFKCMYCDKIHRTLDERQQHIQADHIVKSYACKFCDKVFDIFEKLKIHVLQFHQKTEEEKIIKSKIPPLTCEFCGKTFSSIDVLGGHRRSKHLRRKRCLCCSESFGTDEEYSFHMEVVHRDVKGTVAYLQTSRGCDLCGRTFDSQIEYKEHRNIIHGQPFSCIFCDFEDNDVNVLRQHITDSHPSTKILSWEPKEEDFSDEEAEMPVEEPSLCETCGFSCSSRIELKSHVAKDHFDGSVGRMLRVFPEFRKVLPNIECLKCKKQLQTKESVKVHMKFIHYAGNEEAMYDEFPELLSYPDTIPFICDHCGAVFSAHRSLRRHMEQQHELSLPIRAKSLLFKYFIMSEDEMREYCRCNICDLQYDNHQCLELHNECCHAKESVTQDKVNGKNNKPPRNNRKTHKQPQIKNNIKKVSNETDNDTTLENRSVDEKIEAAREVFRNDHLPLLQKPGSTHKQAATQTRPCNRTRPVLPPLILKDSPMIQLIWGKNICKLCGELCPDETYLKSHVYLHHSKQVEKKVQPSTRISKPVTCTYTCNHCKMVFTELEDVINHTENAHPKLLNSVSAVIIDPKDPKHSPGQVDSQSNKCNVNTVVNAVKNTRDKLISHVEKSVVDTISERPPHSKATDNLNHNGKANECGKDHILKNTKIDFSSKESNGQSDRTGVNVSVSNMTSKKEKIAHDILIIPTEKGLEKFKTKLDGTVALEQDLVLEELTDETGVDGPEESSTNGVHPEEIEISEDDDVSFEQVVRKEFEDDPDENIVSKAGLKEKFTLTQTGVLKGPPKQDAVSKIPVDISLEQGTVKEQPGALKTDGHFSDNLKQGSGGDQSMFQCPLCHRFYKTLENLKRHKENMHSSELRKTQKIWLKPRQFAEGSASCDKQEFIKTNALRKNENTPQCGEVATYKSCDRTSLNEETLKVFRENIVQLSDDEPKNVDGTMQKAVDKESSTIKSDSEKTTAGFKLEKSCVHESIVMGNSNKEMTSDEVLKICDNSNDNERVMNKTKQSKRQTASQAHEEHNKNELVANVDQEVVASSRENKTIDKMKESPAAKRRKAYIVVTFKRPQNNDQAPVSKQTDRKTDPLLDKWAGRKRKATPNNQDNKRSKSSNVSPAKKHINDVKDDTKVALPEMVDTSNLRYTGVCHSDFTCTICRRDFPNERSLLGHRYIVHDTKTTSVMSCNLCQDTFTTRDYLIEHMLTHTSVVSVVCTICDSSFKTKNELEVHQAEHFRQGCETITNGKDGLTTKQKILLQNGK